MSVIRDQSQRRILPRWRISSEAVRSAELTDLIPSKILVIDNGTHLPEALHAFQKQPSIGSAADLISAASMANETAATAEAAAFVLAHEDTAPRTLVGLARSLTQEAGHADSGSPEINVASNFHLDSKAVARTRELLRLHSDNPLLWSDMARHYASCGSRREASRCMQVALQLAPNHRWILRTTVRFLVHRGDSIAAHRMLVQHPRTSKDPWLLAAELATAQVAGRPPRFWRQANDVLRWDRAAPLHLSELATAVGMFELEGGAAKKARKLVEKGLRDPTENALAQVSWAWQNKHLSGISNLDELVRQNDSAFEAAFRLKLTAGDLLAAKEEGERWALDEPFAARPMAGLAFIASVFDDYAATVELEKQTRRIDREIDSTLELNSIFALLSSGMLTSEKDAQKIKAIHDKLVISAKGEGAFHALANLGLWHYRFGDPEIGRLLYQQSIAIAEKSGPLEGAALAASFAARETILAGQPDVLDILDKAKALATRSRSTIAEFYNRKLDELRISPENALDILSPSSAARFMKTPEPKQDQVRLVRGKQGLVAVAPMRKPPPRTGIR